MTCRTCRYWSPDSTTIDLRPNAKGRCLRFPPIFGVALPGQRPGEITINFFFPAMAAGQICGEWILKTAYNGLGVHQEESPPLVQRAFSSASQTSPEEAPSPKDQKT